MPVSRAAPTAREHWVFKQADWHGLRMALRDVDWRGFFSNCDPSSAAEKRAAFLLRTADDFIQKFT
eukprot:5175271-Pyramimonas_sp.AAC.1